MRHPFYPAFIMIGFGAALLFESIPGIILNLSMLPLWNRLAELEEEGLLGYWGGEYEEFMRTRGRFLPAPPRPGRAPIPRFGRGPPGVIRRSAGLSSPPRSPSEPRPR